MSDSLPIGLVWNLESALKGVDGCVSDLRDMLEIFLRQAPALMSDIRSALEKNDPKKLHLAAHTLKGSLQILCADEACAVAGELESLGNKGQTAGGVQLLSKMESQLAGVLKGINEFLEMR